MDSALSSQDLTEHEGDLALIFLTEFQALEQALVRAGFTRAGHIHGNARPDWARFVQHIQRRFRPDCSPELQGAVSYLLCEPDKLALRQERLQSSLPGERCSAQSDILWLAELVQEVGNTLTHGIHFPKKTDYDIDYLTAALMVVAAWSACDPLVESLLVNPQ